MNGLVFVMNAEIVQAWTAINPGGWGRPPIAFQALEQVAATMASKQVGEVLPAAGF